MKNSLSICVSIFDLVFSCNAITEARLVGEAEFKTRTGVTREHARDVYERIRRIEQEVEQRTSPAKYEDNDTKVSVSVDFDDVQLLCKAIIIALDKVKAWEFKTRTGRTPRKGEDAAKLPSNQTQ